MKDELGGKIMLDFAALKPKPWHKRIFEDYKHCSEATQIGNKINQIEKKNLMWIILKNNRLLLKPRQRFKTGNMMYLLKKFTKLHRVLMIIRE